MENAAFCEGRVDDPACDPVHDKHDKAYAIAQIGDLSPAKRMWNIFKSLEDDAKKGKGKGNNKFDLKTVAAGLPPPTWTGPIVLRCRPVSRQVQMPC
jgi:hypothetical protein